MLSHLLDTWSCNDTSLHFYALKFRLQDYFINRGKGELELENISLFQIRHNKHDSIQYNLDNLLLCSPLLGTQSTGKEENFIVFLPLLHLWLRTINKNN